NTQRVGRVTHSIACSTRRARDNAKASRVARISLKCARSLSTLFLAVLARPSYRDPCRAISTRGAVGSESASTILHAPRRGVAGACPALVAGPRSRTARRVRRGGTRPLDRAPRHVLWSSSPGGGSPREAPCCQHTHRIGRSRDQQRAGPGRVARAPDPVRERRAAIAPERTGR